MTRLRQRHALRTRAQNSEKVELLKSLVERLTIKHEAVPDPDAYNKLEAEVLRAKQEQQAKLEQMKQIAVQRASLRKGGLNEVQELLTVLPPSKGPVGRLGHPEKLFGDRILVDTPFQM